MRRSQLWSTKALAAADRSKSRGSRRRKAIAARAVALPAPALLVAFGAVVAQIIDRTMVHSELPISVLFYDQGGAHLFAMSLRA
jgi:hypothetical protein